MPPPLIKRTNKQTNKKTATESLSSQNQSKANGEWANHQALCSWYSHDNATDAVTIIVPHRESLPVAQPATDLATPKIWAYIVTVVSERDQDTLTTRHSCESIRHYTLIGSFSSYFCFYTLVFVLWFPHFSVFHLANELWHYAEYVLNKCITQPHPERQISISGENFVESNPTATADQPVHYNFEHLDAPISNKDHGNHILLWMVSWWFGNTRLKEVSNPT